MILILEAEAIGRALRRIAHEILERNPNPQELILAGIPLRGMELSRRIAAAIEQIEGVRPELGVVDISMHRDDLQQRKLPPAVLPTRLPLRLDGRPLVLIDDVFFTGRTVRAAMDSIASFGRPSCIQLAVLVDRGHRELPIQPDYVGKNLPTSRSERVMVRLAGVDDEPDSVKLGK